MFIDASPTSRSVMDRSVANRPVYVARSIHLRRERDILGLWAAMAGGREVLDVGLTEIKNRGTNDVCIVVCDGLKGLLEDRHCGMGSHLVQTCVIHLLRNTFRFTHHRIGTRSPEDIGRSTPAPVRSQGTVRRVRREVGSPYPAIIGYGRTPAVSSCPSWTRYLEIDESSVVQNAIRSLNAHATAEQSRARGHFPTEQAAMKCLYLVTRFQTHQAERPAMGNGGTRTQRVRDHLQQPDHPDPATNQCQGRIYVNLTVPVGEAVKCRSILIRKLRASCSPENAVEGQRTAP